MTVGFVITEASWAIVQDGLDPAVEVAFVSHQDPDWERVCDESCPDFIVVEALETLLTTELVEEADRRSIEVGALITTPDGEEVASRRGVGHLIRQPIDLVEMVLRSHSIRKRGARTELCVVVGVWGATGAPGRTTVAITVAAMLGKRGVSTPLIDADPRGGAVATHLGLLDEVPGFVACCRLAGRGELSTEHIARLASRYRCSPGEIDVLTGLSREMRDGDAKRDSVDHALGALRAHYEAIVIDLGSDVPSGDNPPANRAADGVGLTAQLLDESDVVWAIIDASPVGVARFARAQSSFDQARGSTPARYILNKVDSSRRAFGDEAALSEALWRFTGISDYWSIPHDFTGAHQAVMAGESVVALGGKQPIVQALSGLVDDLSQLVGGRTARRRAPDFGATDGLRRDSTWVKKITNLLALR